MDENQILLLIQHRWHNSHVDKKQFDFYWSVKQFQVGIYKKKSKSVISQMASFSFFHSVALLVVVLSMFFSITLLLSNRTTNIIQVPIVYNTPYY